MVADIYVYKVTETGLTGRSRHVARRSLTLRPVMVLQLEFYQDVVRVKLPPGFQPSGKPDRQTWWRDARVTDFSTSEVKAPQPWPPAPPPRNP